MAGARTTSQGQTSPDYQTSPLLTNEQSLQLELNQSTISQISEFVQKSSINAFTAKVASALVLTGPSIASHALLFEQLSTTIIENGDSLFVTLTSGFAPNFKTLLKHLIQKATAVVPNEDDDEEVARSNKQRPRLLNYDLRLLHEHVLDKHVNKVVIAFQDCEAFDGQLLSEVIELLRYISPLPPSYTLPTDSDIVAGKIGSLSSSSLVLPPRFKTSRPSCQREQRVAFKDNGSMLSRPSQPSRKPLPIYTPAAPLFGSAQVYATRC